ncbi:hypothetical protein ACIBI3_43515 [Actinomadura luteofluorescens]|uniref:hypothetical protein n=1 Tax=Actinomadura luteofluorescens TaxID=46163 RepID=UPI00348AECE3
MENGEEIQKAELHRGTMHDWIKSWTVPEKRLIMPQFRDQFLTLVFALSAERDVDWSALYRAAECEKEKTPARKAIEVQARHRRRSSPAYRLMGVITAAGLTAISAPTLVIVINDPDHKAPGPDHISGPRISPAASASPGPTPLDGSSENLGHSEGSHCTYVKNGPAGVYPAPDDKTQPVKWKKDFDPIVVLHKPPAPRGWLVVFTPKDAPGYLWMLDRQLGPLHRCEPPQRVS